MAVAVQDELMALGSWSVDLDYRADILAELVDEVGRPRKVHVQVYAPGNVLIYTGLLLSVEGDERGLSISGRNLLWWLGVGEDGHIVVDREHVSGGNKLSNGGFDLGDLYWRFAEGSGWQAYQAANFAYLGSGYASNAGRTGKDDILQSDEKFPTRPGYQYVTSCQQKRVYADLDPGHLRLRTVYEGRFDPPNLPSLPGTYTVGPIAKPQVVTNGSFETGTLANWLIVGGAWAATNVGTSAHQGGFVMKIDGTTPAVNNHILGNASATAPQVAYAAIPSRKYRFQGHIRREGATTDGKAYINVNLGQTVSGSNVLRQLVALGTADSGSETGKWYQFTTEIDIPTDVSYFFFEVLSVGQTLGTYWFDNFSATILDGNTATTTGVPVTVTPERTYRLAASVTSGLALQQGKVHFSATFTGEGRTSAIAESPAIESTAGATTRQTWDFTPPSGYTSATVSIVGTDIDGASFTIKDVTIADVDRASVVIDSVSSAATHDWTLLSHTTTAPAGAETVRVELVAEDRGGAYLVDEVGIRRTGVTLATGNAIVAALLTSPTTGSPLSVLPGTIVCPEIVPYDWRILNRSNRDALNHYCSVVSSPPREYRLNPNRTLDVATAAILFVDRHPTSASPVVLLSGDIDIPDGLPAVRTDAEERVTEVRVLGAERKTASGETVLITATAQVPGPVEVDWDGRPVVRTRLVSDATVDHVGYAQALANDIAAREAVTPATIEATLTGLNTRPSFGVGDWVYVYKPESGIEDLNNPTTINGEHVFPKRVRVLGRRRELGPQHRVDIRRANGTSITLPGVLWSPADTTTLTLGVQPPGSPFVADPQGGATGGQYLRDRVSSPRR